MTLFKARDALDIRTVDDLLELASRFEKWMVIPGSVAVVVAGLLAALAEDLSFTADGNRWLLVSLILFVATLLLVPTVFLPRGKIFERALAEARSRGEVTTELTAAFHDPAVAFARITESAVVAVVIVMMVVKPF